MVITSDKRHDLKKLLAWEPGWNQKRTRRWTTLSTDGARLTSSKDDSE
jgi:hypothetical protein